MRMCELLGPDGPQASALARTLVHRGLKHADAERSAAETVRRRASGDGEPQHPTAGPAPRGWARRRMRPQSASAGTSSRHEGVGDGEQLAPQAAGAWAPQTAEPLPDELGSHLLTQPVEGELEAVLLETVSTLTAERGRLAEQ